jgi:hypothetical protein
LKLFNDGYSVGWDWIVQHPVDFSRLTARKLVIFWSGAASGLTSWNLPAGFSGLRRPVDMVAPDRGAPAAIWQVAVLLGCFAGMAAGRRNRALVPWLVFLATRIVATVLFFGYARQGATAIPIVTILLALALERWTPAHPSRLAIPVLVVGVTLEAARFIMKPEVRLDGTAVGSRDPYPENEHDAHRLEERLR